MTPATSFSLLDTVRTGNGDWVARISPRWLRRFGAMCWAITNGAGNSRGSDATKLRSASMPPADAPTTTNGVGRRAFSTDPSPFVSPPPTSFKVLPRARRTSPNSIWIGSILARPRSSSG